MTEVENRADLRIENYADLWRWSVGDVNAFWTAVWNHFGVQSSTDPGPALAEDRMPGAIWFPTARLNYAAHALEDADPDRQHDLDVAVVAYSQTRERRSLTFAELRDAVARTRAGLQSVGVGRGDRVAGYLPNIPETVVAFLATASLGATWASCAPEFGARSVIDRFSQVEPKVLLGVTGYRYGDKVIDRTAEMAEICAGLPTLATVVHVPYGEFDAAPAGAVSWAEITAKHADARYEPVPFNHPLCILFTSGTTGLPKPIIHGHGGTLLEHLKNHALSWDLGPGDRLMWFTTTAWMMWNYLISALLVRSAVVLIDGDPTFPSLDLQWQLAADSSVTVLGVSPGYLMACRSAGMSPEEDHDLRRIRQLAAAGSPLPAEGFRWVHTHLPAAYLNVGSGGTDVCSAIVQGSPLQPVVEGEISGPALGVAASAFDENGQPVVSEFGELVITRPMPSMPVGFWGDDDDSRYRSAYFTRFPGVWRHGDWVRFSPAGSCMVAGRSDATLNRGGVRLGTAEFYRVVEELQGVNDSLIVHLEDPHGGMGRLFLFVVPAGGGELSDGLRSEIVDSLRTSLSPRHVPDVVMPVAQIPRNRSGKKLELPVKQILLGRPVQEVITPGSVTDERSIDAFVRLANELDSPPMGSRT